MRCEKVRLKIDPYVSGELAPQARIVVEEHLKACAGCQRAVESARRLIVLGRTSPTPPVPNGFADRIMALARQRTAHPSPAAAAWSFPAWWRTVSMPVRAAAAAVLVIGLASGALMGWNTWRPLAAPPTQAVSQANPLAPYNVDYLTDAPDGSLAQSYLALVSSPAQEGK
jgi:anti-sigma factor RsiW